MARFISNCRSQNIYFRYANLLECYLQGLWDERTENSCKEYINYTGLDDHRIANKEYKKKENFGKVLIMLLLLYLIYLFLSKR